MLKNTRIPLLLSALALFAFACTSTDPAPQKEKKAPTATTSDEEVIMPSEASEATPSDATAGPNTPRKPPAPSKALPPNKALLEEGAEEDEATKVIREVAWKLAEEHPEWRASSFLLEQIQGPSTPKKGAAKSGPKEKHGHALGPRGKTIKKELVRPGSKALQGLKKPTPRPKGLRAASLSPDERRVTAKALVKEANKRMFGHPDTAATLYSLALKLDTNWAYHSGYAFALERTNQDCQALFHYRLCQPQATEGAKVKMQASIKALTASCPEALEETPEAKAEALSKEAKERILDKPEESVSRFEQALALASTPARQLNYAQALERAGRSCQALDQYLLLQSQTDIEDQQKEKASLGASRLKNECL